MSDTLYDRGYRFTHLNTAGTVTITSSPTRFVGVVLNTFNASGVVDIYNGTAVVPAQKVASIGTSVANTQRRYEYDVVLSGGLTVALTSTPNITVIYR